MTDFEIDVIFNTICRPGRVVRILTKNGKEENIPVSVPADGLRRKGRLRSNEVN